MMRLMQDSIRVPKSLDGHLLYNQMFYQKDIDMSFRGYNKIKLKNTFQFCTIEKKNISIRRMIIIFINCMFVVGAGNENRHLHFCNFTVRLRGMIIKGSELIAGMKNIRLESLEIPG